MIVDSDFLVFLNGRQRNNGTSIAVDVSLPDTVGTTGMVNSGDPEIQVLAGLLAHSVS